jgi:hypothetical protein
MPKHRSHKSANQRQVAEQLIAAETLHALAQRHDISRPLIRIWVGKFEAGALDGDLQAADLLQEYEARIAALERMVGRRARGTRRLGHRRGGRGREARRGRGRIGGGRAAVSLVARPGRHAAAGHRHRA